MENIKLNGESHDDYMGRAALAKVKNVKMTKKIVEVDGAKVVLVNLRGVEPDGHIVNVDLWPRNEATVEDLAKLPEEFSDIIFRVGYFKQVDEKTGEVRTVAGAPKVLAYFKPGETEPIFLSGAKHEFDTTWTNAPRS